MDESEFIQDEVTIASVRKFKTCLNLIDALTGICKYRGGLSKNWEFHTPMAVKPSSPCQQSRFIQVSIERSRTSLCFRADRLQSEFESSLGKVLIDRTL